MLYQVKETRKFIIAPLYSFPLTNFFFAVYRIVEILYLNKYTYFNKYSKNLLARENKIIRTYEVVCINLTFFKKIYNSFLYYIHFDDI